MALVNAEVALDRMDRKILANLQADGRLTALDSLDLELQSGDVFGFIGGDVLRGDDAHLELEILLFADFWHCDCSQWVILS